jgi:hypothetical protein
MGHEEKYCIWSCSSIGGCPLEEASEQERIPSIIGSIVWCFPTLRVSYNKSVVSSIFSLWIYCVFSICGDYICRYEDELWAREGIFLSDETYRLLYSCQRTLAGEEHAVDRTGLEQCTGG